MSEQSELPDALDQILGQFLAELEQTPDVEELIQRYAARYPQHTAEFQDAVEMRELLNREAEDVVQPQPERLGDFRIVREISRGGMKIVYEAIQESLNRRVAVATIREGRILPPSANVSCASSGSWPAAPDPHRADLRGRGGRIDSVLRHAVHRGSRLESARADRCAVGDRPLRQQDAGAEGTGSLCRRQDPREFEDPLGNAGTEPWLAGLGSSVQQRPAGRRDRFVLSQDYFHSVARVMADVADSLHYAHERGFVHRDLKPANIMVDTDEQSWLIDFGLAAILAASDKMPAEHDHDRMPVKHFYKESCGTPTRTMGVIGTRGYMAPEQEAGGDTDARTDVWGLGVTFYELLTLHRAFDPQAGTKREAPDDRKRPAAPRKLIPNIPGDLEAICLKALKVSASARYQTADQFGQDLKRWLRGEPPTAAGARAPRRVYLWAKRNRGWALAIAVFPDRSVLHWYRCFSFSAGSGEGERTPILDAPDGKSVTPRSGQWLVERGLGVGESGREDQKGRRGARLGRGDADWDRRPPAHASAF